MSSAIHFDLSREPVSQGALVHEQRRLESERTRSWMGVACAWLGQAGVAGIGMVAIDWCSTAATPFLVLLTAFLLGLGLLGLHNVWVAMNAAAALLEFDAPSHEETLKALAWCHAHPALAAYQAKVSASGRSLVKGEVAAMDAWVANAKHRGAHDFQRPAVAVGQPHP